MKDAIKQFLIGFLYTFTNDKRGNSARKTTAFALMVCVFFIHVKFITVDSATNFLIIDLSFVALLLGVVTAQNLIELKLGKKSNE